MAGRDAGDPSGEELPRSEGGEGWFHSFLRSTADVVTVLSADNTVLYDSPSIERAFGYAPGERVGQKGFGYVHPGDRERVGEAFAELLEKPGVDVPLEYRMRRKDGSWRHVEATRTNLLDDPEVGGVVIVYRDVTGRKEAEGQLRFQARLLDAVGQAVVAIDLEERITYWNRAAEGLYGWSAEEVIGRLAREILVSEDQRERAAKIQAELAEGRTWSGEFVVRRRDGATFPVTVTDTPVEDEGGNLVGVIGVSADVTERKRAEARLKEAEERYRVLVDNMPPVAYVEELGDGRPVYMSPRVEGLVGHPPERFTEDPRFWWGLVHPEDRERVLAENARADDTGDPFKTEYRLVTGDGRVVWVRDEAVLVRVGAGGGYWQGVMLDITERKAAEEALGASEERFRALVQNASDMISILGPDGTIRYVSPSVERVLGYRPEERVGTDAFGAETHPDDVEGLREAFAEGLGRPGGVSRTLEFRVRRKDGSWRHLEAVATNRLGHPAVGGIVVNARDVTEREEAERRLRESEAGQRRRARELELLHRARTALSKELDPEKVLRAVVDAVAAAYGYTLVSAYLLEGEGPQRELVLQHQVGYRSELTRIPIDRGVMARTARTGEPALLMDAHSDPDFLDAIQGVVSEVCVPLLDEGQVVGVLNVESTGEAELTEEDLGLMVALGEHAGIALGRARLHERVRESEERYRRLVESSPEAVVVHDGRKVLYANPAAARLFGAQSPVELVGREVVGFVHPDDRAVVAARVREVLEGGKGAPPLEERYLRLDGSVVDAEVAGEPITYAGKPAVQVVLRDVSGRKRMEEELRHRATHDPLTALPNRRLLLERLRHALERREGEVTLLFLDLDGFKVVNDSLGHEAGDRLLVAAAGRIGGAVRPSDTVARLGGDEFVVLLEDTGREGASRAAERVLAALEAPFVVEGHELRTSASIGIALGGRYRAAGPGELMREADLAMYRAKEEGKARHAVYDPSMDARARERLELRSGLWRALGRGEFAMRYQPVVSLETRTVVGLEALVRWEHPERGILSPGEFLAEAEYVGLSGPLFGFALGEACRLAALLAKGATSPAGQPWVSVNLPPPRLRDPGLADEVARGLRDTGVPAGELVVETTEDAAMEGSGEAEATLGRLKALGARVAIDDFGTGYSSLSHLERLPADFLKLDRAYVANLASDGRRAAVVRGMVGLAHALGLAVIAEGVETEAQLEILRGAGCDLAQGYLLAEPLAAEEVPSLVAQGC